LRPDRSRHSWGRWGFLVSLVALLAACGNPAAGIKGRIEAKATGSSFAMKDVTTFAWDRLFIYPPYSDPDRIDAEVGARVDAGHGNLFGGSMLTRSDVCLLVFRDRGKVVATLEVNVHELDFQSSGGRAGGYPPQSRFVKHGGAVPSVDPVGVGAAGDGSVGAVPESS